MILFSPKVAKFVSQESCQGRSEDEEHWNDGINHCHFLNVQPQRLHVKVEVGIEHCHGCRLEKKDKLDPNQVSEGKVFEHPLEHGGGFKHESVAQQVAVGGKGVSLVVVVSGLALV